MNLSDFHLNKENVLNDHRQAKVKFKLGFDPRYMSSMNSFLQIHIFYSNKFQHMEAVNRNSRLCAPSPFEILSFCKCLERQTKS